MANKMMFGVSELVECFQYALQKDTVISLTVDPGQQTMTVTFGISNPLVKKFVNSIKDGKDGK